MDFCDIEKIVSETINSTAYKKLISEKRLNLFGMGFNGEMAVNYFKKNSYLIEAFCDNDKAKFGCDVEGIVCVSPQDLAQKSDCVCVLTVLHYQKEIEKQASALNLEYISFNSFVLCQNFDKIKKLYDLVEDDFSKKTLQTVLFATLTGDRTCLNSVYEPNAYFCFPQLMRHDEVFIDCGAFDGDTVEQFIVATNGVFDKIFAFEPWENSYKKLLCKISQLQQDYKLLPNQILPVNKAMSDYNGVSFITVNQNEMQNRVLPDGKDGTKITVGTLDNVFASQKGTMIKADIEGSEMAMLRGAEQFIKAQKPKIVVALYHRPEDFFEVPDFLQSLVPEYHFAIRHHSVQLMDTFLYCWQVNGGGGHIDAST